MTEPEYVQHALIKSNSIQKRLYQETIIGTAVKWNTLVVLPTGVGKTILAVLAAAFRLQKYPNSKSIVLAPTKPLALQHLKTFCEFMSIPEDQIAIITGEITPQKRQVLWNDFKIALMTPQVLQNDLLAGRYSLEDVSLLVFDEAHRAIGDYAYVFIASQYKKHSHMPLVMALTASPGSEIEKIREIVSNLHIENIELRTRESPDVAPYLPRVDFEWLEIKLPDEFLNVVKALRRAIRKRLIPIKDADLISSTDSRNVSVRQILHIQRELQHQIANTPSPPSQHFQLVSHCAAIIRLYHCVELLETQGVGALHRYFDALQQEAKRRKASKAVQGLLQDPDVLEAQRLVNELITSDVEHPKLEKLATIVRNQLAETSNSRIMIFTRFRDTARLIETTLTAVPNARPIRFVGQATRAGDRGLTQKEQGEILQLFSEGTYNVLVATSVGEEGLDIQECDLVIFYEAVPSAVRLIQRRGRTARTQPGRVIVLVALGTRDQGYYWASVHREAKMKDLLKEMKKMSRDIEQERKQSTLKDFMKSKTQENSSQTEAETKIIVDNRELRSAITKALKELDIAIEVETLEVADYILSDRVAIEAKTSDDFAQSIIDKRLFQQLGALKDSFEIPILLITGPSLYGSSGINPAAIRGAISAALTSFNIPVINVKTPEEAAALMFTIARQEQSSRKMALSIRGKKPVLSMSSLQEYIVAGLPGVNTTLAKRLLAKFQTITELFNANAEELAEVHGIGKSKAQTIRETLDTHYEIEE